MTTWGVESYFDARGRALVEEFLDHLLHAFLKKTQETPKSDLAIAKARLADFLEAEE